MTLSGGVWDAQIENGSTWIVVVHASCKTQHVMFKLLVNFNFCYNKI